MLHYQQEICECLVFAQRYYYTRKAMLRETLRVFERRSRNYVPTLRFVSR
jgi:hypothetical protein